MECHTVIHNAIMENDFGNDCELFIYAETLIYHEDELCLSMVEGNRKGL